MRYITFLFALTVLSFTFVVSCKRSSENTLDHEIETTGQQMTRTEATVGDATKDLEAYAYTQKTHFRRSSSINERQN